MTSLTEDWGAFQVHKAKKSVSGSNVGGNGGDEASEVIPLKFSSQLAAIVDA